MALTQRIRMPEHIEYPKGKPPRVRLVVPPNLQEAVGKITGKGGKVANLRELLRSYDPADIKRRKPEIEARLQAIIAAAERMALPRIPAYDLDELIARHIELHDMIMAGARIMQQRIDAGEDQMPTAEELQEIRRQARAEVAADYGVADPPMMYDGFAIKPAKRVTPYHDSVNDWGAKLGKGETTVKRQLSKMQRLFDFLAVRRGQPGFDDMNAVTEADLIAYEEESLSPMVAARDATCGGTGRRSGTWKQKTVDDHIIQIKAGFAHARRRLHIDADPSTVLRSYHPDDDGANSGADEEPWEKYRKTEAADIILPRAAVAVHPLVKFGNWIAAHHGSRAAEIAEARTNHIYQDEDTGLWVFDYTLKDRPKGRRIKTGFSARKLPLPDVILHDLGLLSYIDRVRREYHGGEHGDLFPMLKEREQRLNRDASAVLMAFLRNECGITAERKVFHSWRSTVATALEGKIPETRARKITGHAPRTKGEKYIQHDLADLAAANEYLTYIPKVAP